MNIRFYVEASERREQVCEMCGAETACGQLAIQSHRRVTHTSAIRTLYFAKIDDKPDVRYYGTQAVSGPFAALNFNVPTECPSPLQKF